MDHYLFLDVKIIKTGKIGMVIAVGEDGVLVEFDDGSQEWYYESDIVEVGL